MTPRRMTLAALVLAACLYASAALLLLWAADLDGQARVRAYSTPATRLPPIDRCHQGRVPWSCAP